MELLKKVFECGIVGAGGAGFPAHIKLNCRAEYFIINAAECEPLLFTDKYIMKAFPREIIKAAEEVSNAVEAAETYFAVKGVNTYEIAALEEAAKGTRIKIFKLDNYYPAGDEQVLVYDITKRTVPHQGIPLNVGALVSNVSTMLNVYGCLSDIPVTHKYLTVTGKVDNPLVLKVPIGISFKECIDFCGGATLTDYKVISGGPMMGRVFHKDEASKQVVTKTTSGIIIIDEANFVARQKDTDIKKILSRAKSACIQCSFCTELCPRALIGHNIRPHRVMRHMSSMDFDGRLAEDDIIKEAFLCSECGVCEAYACPMGLSPRQVNKFVKEQLAGKKYDVKTEEYSASLLRDYRKIAPARIMMRMGIDYNVKANGFSELSTASVRIPLKQHIGIPAQPCVNVGDSVCQGSIIASGPFDNVVANVHSSISGRVVNIDDAIEIEGGM